MNFTRQDAIILNLLRACEASIDLAVHDYQALSLPILKTILEERFGDFLEFTSVLWYQDNPEG